MEPESGQSPRAFHPGIATVPPGEVVRIFPDIDVVVPGEYLRQPSLRPPSYGLWKPKSPTPFKDTLLDPRHTNYLPPDVIMKEIESEPLVFRSRPRLGRDLRISLDFDFAGSHLDDEPAPLAPNSHDDDILLDARDDQGLHGSPQLSFELNQSKLDFTVTSTGDSSWTQRIGSQIDTSLPSKQRSFSELVAQPGPGQHLSVIPHRHHYGGSTTSSSTSNSFVHLTPQGSSQASLAQTPGSNAVVSPESNSARESSPRVSTPGHHSQDDSQNSPPGDPLQVRPRVGPSKKWDLRPKPKRGRKPTAKPRHKLPGPTKGNPSSRSRRTRPLSPASRHDFRVVKEAGGACRLCHYKKCKCTPDPSDPNGPCQNCVRPALCYRYSVTEASLYREQEAPNPTFSKRWASMDLADITDWESNDTRRIFVSQVLLNAPYELVVRRFTPREGDRLEKVWHKDGAQRRFAVPAYAIVNMEAAANSIDTMVTYSQHIYLDSFLKQRPEDHGGDFLWQTYRFAFQYPAQVKDETAALLISNAFRLWVACRFTSHPDAIVGTETLGMTEKAEYPSDRWEKHYPTPPVMGAQLECILYSRFLRPLSKKVQDLLDDLMMKKRTHDTWLTVYLALFVLLHSCAMLTKRDAEYAHQMKIGRKYANPEAIKAHQKGAITLLAHFHGVLGGPTPFALAGTGGLESFKKNWDFSEDQEAFMRATYVRTRVMGEFLQQVRRKGDLSDEWYWVSQLYDKDWAPDKMD